MRAEFVKPKGKDVRLLPAANFPSIVRYYAINLDSIYTYNHAEHIFNVQQDPDFVLFLGSGCISNTTAELTSYATIAQEEFADFAIYFQDFQRRDKDIKNMQLPLNTFIMFTPLRDESRPGVFSTMAVLATETTPSVHIDLIPYDHTIDLPDSEDVAVVTRYAPAWRVGDTLNNDYVRRISERKISKYTQLLSPYEIQKFDYGLGGFGSRDDEGNVTGGVKLGLRLANIPLRKEEIYSVMKILGLELEFELGENLLLPDGSDHPVYWDFDLDGQKYSVSVAQTPEGLYFVDWLYHFIPASAAEPSKQS